MSGCLILGETSVPRRGFLIPQPTSKQAETKRRFNGYVKASFTMPSASALESTHIERCVLILSVYKCV